MKFLLTFLMFFLIPVIICFALLYATAPLFMQRIFHLKKSSDRKLYLYQTSWEEAA